ncbi:MAG: ABC transporter ATP-binding protein [Opitutaceae bacterium]|jgi:ABC-2 type transport system ATP-binding protein|nr:ABC transporter ATP-binding protein [Opitutaceae bacterium]
MSAADGADAPAIEVRELAKSYAGVMAVNKITFSVGRGEIVGFLGPNGAGKSTTMRILTGFLPATSGEALIRGVPVASRAADVKRLIGYMPENNPLPEDMRVSEYLHYRGRLKEMPRRKLALRLPEVLDLCDIQHVRHRIIGGLSKGYRQRVGIADAILAEPPVIIMDEPTIGLDPHQILIVRDLIAGLRGRMTVLISSHILPEIEMTCDRVIIINQGRIVAEGTPAELRKELFGRARYTVEIAGDAAGLAALLASVDPALEARGGEDAGGGFRRLTLTTPEAADLGEPLVRAFAAAPGFRLRSIVRDEPSLEDVFLAATKRGWDVVDKGR